MTAKHARTLEELDQYFSFELAGTTHVMPLKTADIFTPGWVRSHRRLGEADYMLTLLENLAGHGNEPRVQGVVTDEERTQGEAILAALDDAGWPEHKRVQGELADHIGATAGE